MVEKQFLKREDMAKILDVHPITIDRWIRKHEVSVLIQGGVVRVHKKEFNKLIEKITVTAVSMKEGF